MWPRKNGPSARPVSAEQSAIASTLIEPASARTSSTERQPPAATTGISFVRSGTASRARRQLRDPSFTCFSLPCVATSRPNNKTALLALSGPNTSGSAGQRGRASLTGHCAEESAGVQEPLSLKGPGRKHAPGSASGTAPLSANSPTCGRRLGGRRPHAARS